MGRARPRLARLTARRPSVKSCVRRLPGAKPTNLEPQTVAGSPVRRSGNGHQPSREEICKSPCRARSGRYPLPSGHLPLGWAGRPTPRTAGPIPQQSGCRQSSAFDASPGKYGGRSKRARAFGQWPSGWLLSAAWLLATVRCPASVRGRLSSGKPNGGGGFGSASQLRPRRLNQASKPTDAPGPTTSKSRPTARRSPEPS